MHSESVNRDRIAGMQAMRTLAGHGCRVEAH